jgi:hypothetical protein
MAEIMDDSPVRPGRFTMAGGHHRLQTYENSRDDSLCACVFVKHRTKSRAKFISSGS